MRTLTSEQWRFAKKLLAEAVQHQMELENGPMQNELIEGTTPVLWFGDATKTSWLTVATNPSAGQFLKKDGTMRYDATGPFFLRESGMSLSAYQNDRHYEQSIRKYNCYFQQKDVYKTWFGKEQGGKLEGFLNGFGASLYDPSLQSVIHTDFFPLPTKRYMGTISMRHELEETVFGQTFFLRLLPLFSLHGIILLGREHTDRFRKLDSSVTWKAPITLTDYPDAVVEFGYSAELGLPIIGLHFKPSEQFLGLGSRNDENEVSHGTYGSANGLREIGRHVRKKLDEFYPAED
ncbi:hypothetical protein BLD48_05285 [Exiguobacterium sp. KRL4]|uniref:hypothetical protein n=1 Tax=Exiguobacterium sp. KRL4 TaxID=1914536 RepID=UPI0008F85DF7|nr:hypothetical protein [Exiguobacterium sp. KRL4]OIN67701.1 hypothetical protein BLD48_05285 [Exiguobacterium sp. KRL4]